MKKIFAGLALAAQPDRRGSERQMKLVGDVSPGSPNAQ